MRSVVVIRYKAIVLCHVVVGAVDCLNKVAQHGAQVLIKQSTVNFAGVHKTIPILNQCFKRVKQVLLPSPIRLAKCTSNVEPRIDQLECLGNGAWTLKREGFGY